MILVNFCHSQQTQQILSTAEHSENFKKPILTTFIKQNTMCDSQFHCCEKMAKEKENKTEHVQTSKPRADTIILAIYGYCVKDTP